jgi:hypothetical protein
MRKILLLVFSTWILASCYTKHHYPIKTTSGNLMDSLSGVLTSEKNIVITKDTTIFSESANAYFHNHPKDSAYLQVGSVIVNYDTLNFILNHYEKQLSGTDTGANWQVFSGFSTIPSFSYSFFNPYPSYYIVPPDTIHISQGFSFPCMFVNTDSVDVMLGFDTLGNAFHKTLKPTDTVFALSKSQLSKLSPVGAALFFSLHKYTIKTYNYKHFAFFKNYNINYSRTVFVP